MGKEKVICFLKRHPFVMDVVSVFYNIFHSWDYVRYGIFGPLSCRGVFLNHVKIVVKGRDCSIVIGRRTRLNHCIISIRGDNCSLSIAGGTTMINHTLLDMFRDGSSIRIGSSFSMEGGRIEAMDGKKIKIGGNCMFSRGVEICNGDNHPIFSMENKKERLNPSSDVVIGDHVWLSAYVRVLKGVRITNDVIVGSGSLVSKDLEVSHSVFVGIPAVLKNIGITWKRA